MNLVLEFCRRIVELTESLRKRTGHRIANNVAMVTKLNDPSLADFFFLEQGKFTKQCPTTNANNVHPLLLFLGPQSDCIIGSVNKIYGWLKSNYFDTISGLKDAVSNNVYLQDLVDQCSLSGIEKSSHLEFWLAVRDFLEEVKHHADIIPLT
jgi:hypothetical protein